VTNVSKSLTNKYYPLTISDEGVLNIFGGELLSHDAVPSALTGLTSLLGMGRGISK